MTNEPQTTPTWQVLNQKLTELQETLEEHEVILNGNGQPGVKTRLAILEDRYLAVDRKINAVLAMLVTMILSGGGITVWFITTVLPELYGHIGKP